MCIEVGVHSVCNSKTLNSHRLVFVTDPSSLGRWYHGKQVTGPHRQDREGKGKRTGTENGLSCFIYLWPINSSQQGLDFCHYSGIT